MVALDNGLALGADGLELDVQLSSDGIPVVIHDKTLDRTTGEVVNQFPREEVLKLRDSPAYQAGRVIVTKA